MNTIEDRTPVLNGDFYGSRSCCGATYCKKADYDRCVADSARWAKELGKGWEPRVHENLGWHWSLVKGPIHLHQTYDRSRIDAPPHYLDHWFTTGTFSGEGDTPFTALCDLRRQLLTERDRLNATLELLDGC